MYEAIPAEIRVMRQWVIWGVDEADPKMPKCVRRPEIGARANDPATWGSFDEAVAAVARLGRGGIGFEFGEAGGIAGIDLDHVIGKDGKLKEFAADIVRTMDSYTEYSPSEEGLHIFFKLTEPLSQIGSRNKDQELGLEIYDTGRYFRMTGKVYGELKGIEERTEEARAVYAKYMAKPKPEKKQAPQTVAVHTEDMTDYELWERMFEAENGGKIRALYQGDILGYGSQSEADLALCNHLAWWTQGDERKIDAMFRASGLMRPKWDEMHGAQTYGQMTIQKAIEGLPGNSYDPQYRREGLTRPAKSDDGKEGASTEDKERADFEHDTAAFRLNGFMKYLIDAREGKAIPTGFEELDSKLDGGLYPGLYIVGAISSLGKTTFCTQIADQIAQRGYGVLIFSLEMSAYEIMSKSLSRLTMIKEHSKKDSSVKHALSTRQVLRCDWSNGEAARLFEVAFKEYASYAANLSITEGIGNIGVNEIKAKIDQYKKFKRQPPVVVIDYLQILAPYSDKLTDKQNVDKNVLELKRLSRDMQIPIIGISSFNRENYNAPVSMASFKESGAIEYSSDVLIGLQYEGWDYKEGEKDTDRTKRVREMYEAITRQLNEKRGAYAPVQAKILKNRNGRKGNLRLRFYPAFNYFEGQEG